MSIRKSIWDSQTEEKVYQQIKTNWSDMFNVYPQVPFSKIIDVSRLNLSRDEEQFLYKTNIDYTICDKNDRPIMCIEFDGVGRGFSRSGKYIHLEADSKREMKLRLKLRIAFEKDFPFFIVSYDEIENYDENLQVTILDGIIGQHLVGKEFANEFVNMCEEYEKSHPLLDKGHSEDFEFAIHLANLARIKLEKIYDPIVRTYFNLLELLKRKEVLIGEETISEDTSPKFETNGTAEKYYEKAEKVKYYFCKCSIDTIGGSVSKEVKLNNFEGFEVSPDRIAKNLAKLLTVYEACILNGIEV